MKKTVLVLFVAVAVCSSLFCEKIRLGILNGPSCVPAAYLLENNKTLDCSYEAFADPQSLLPKMVKGEIDIGFMPVNVAAKVYNSGNGVIKCCAITGNGNLSLITTDKNVNSIASLKGKTVSVAGQGATPEYLFRYLLEKNDLPAGNKSGVMLDYSIPPAQIPAQLISGKIKYAIVPEPFSTVAQLKSQDVFVAVDLQQEFEYFAGEGKTYPLTVMVVTKKFAQENQALLNEFLSYYEESYKYTIKNPKAAGELCEKYNLGLAASVVTKSIPKANYEFIPSVKEEARTRIEELLNIFLSFDEKSIGGKLPDQEFYY